MIPESAIRVYLLSHAGASACRFAVTPALTQIVTRTHSIVTPAARFASSAPSRLRNGVAAASPTMRSSGSEPDPLSAALAARRGGRSASSRSQAAARGAAAGSSSERAKDIGAQTAAAAPADKAESALSEEQQGRSGTPRRSGSGASDAAQQAGSGGGGSASGGTYGLPNEEAEDYEYERSHGSDVLTSKSIASGKNLATGVPLLDEQGHAIKGKVRPSYWGSDISERWRPDGAE